MMLELQRVFSLAGGRSKGRMVFELFVLPLLVACVMTTAFLARSSPDAQGEAFLFFGTLYAFWCGLFGACQTFNGEVASGEWSYWMLGMRRGVWKHYAAHFAAAFLFAAVQVAVSLFFLWFLWQLGVWIKPLGSFFIRPGEGNSFINQVGALLEGGSAYNLEGLQAIMNKINADAGSSNMLWFAFCCRYYVFGVASAVASGVAIGLLLGAVCPSPQISLTASVFLIVACCICSHTGLVGFGSDSRAEREFAPIDLLFRQRGRPFAAGDAPGQTRWKDGGAVEQFAHLLPQRYFFNIARTPCMKLEASLGLDGKLRPWTDAGRLREHSAGKTDCCKCPVCLGFVTVSERAEGFFVAECDGKEIPLASHWIAAGRTEGKWRKHVFGPCGEGDGEGDVFGDDVPKSERPREFRKAIDAGRGGVKSLFALCRRMAIGEALALLLWCCFYAVATVALLKRRGMFNELR